LPAADDQDPCSGELVEAHQIARVGRSVRCNRRRPAGNIRVIADARSGQDSIGDNALTGGERRFESAVGPGEVGDEPVEDLDALGLPEPLGVVEEHADRKWIHLVMGDRMLLQIRLERVYPSGVEMPVRTGAQKHALRHILPPERHRTANDDCVDATLTSQAGRRQRVRPRPNDEKVCGDHACSPPRWLTPAGADPEPPLDPIRHQGLARTVTIRATTPLPITRRARVIGTQLHVARRP